jgi:hypothetical protein
MNRRRQFFSTIGLGFLLAGGAAAVPREEFAATAKPHRIQAARGHGSVLDNCGFAASENQEVALWHEVEFLTPTEFLDQIRRLAAGRSRVDSAPQSAAARGRRSHRQR